jgi:hypothetical protein
LETESESKLASTGHIERLKNIFGACIRIPVKPPTTITVIFTIFRKRIAKNLSRGAPSGREYLITSHPSNGAILIIMKIDHGIKLCHSISIIVALERHNGKQTKFLANPQGFMKVCLLPHMANVDIPVINHFYLGSIDFIEYPLLSFGVEVMTADSSSPWPPIGVSGTKSHVLMKM